MPTVPVDALETQNVKAALIVGYRSIAGSVLGDMLHWQTHRLTKLICLKSPLNCKGESVSLFCLTDLPCFAWGVSRVSVLLYCMFAKEAERKRTK